MVVVWEENALVALEGQFAWYVKEMGYSAALKFRRGVFSDVDLIARNSQIGRFDDELNAAMNEQKWRSLLSGRKYRIIYYVKDETLHIMAVWACVREKKALKRIIKKGI